MAYQKWGAQMRTLRQLLTMRWTVVISLAVGAVLSNITPAAWFDSIFPVVSMNAEVVAKSYDEVVLKLSGTKHRDCKYISIDAFSRHGDLLRDLDMVRVDRPAEGGTKPKGSFDFGVWKIWPTNDTKMVTVYVRYDCSGRDVFVNVAEVQI